jgi:hypothetical protein
MYQASVPVFRHYLSRIADMVAVAGPEALDLPGAGDVSARRRFEAATALAMEVCCQLSGTPLPDLPQALGPRLAVARALMGTMKPADFEGAETRAILHRAGTAEVRQTGAEYLFLYGLPNFFFQLALGHAALVQAGVALGPGDFDGFHGGPGPGT